jgi:hypothetical protein
MQILLLLFLLNAGANIISLLFFFIGKDNLTCNKMYANYIQYTWSLQYLVILEAVTLTPMIQIMIMYGFFSDYFILLNFMNDRNKQQDDQNDNADSVSSNDILYVLSNNPIVLRIVTNLCHHLYPFMVVNLSTTTTTKSKQCVRFVV